MECRGSERETCVGKNLNERTYAQPQTLGSRAVQLLALGQCSVYVGTAIVSWDNYFEEHNIRFYKILGNGIY